MESQFFEALKAAIRKSGISQSEIAKNTGTQQGSISRFLKGDTGLSAEATIKITQFLGGKIIFPGDFVSDRCEGCRHLEEKIVALEVERDFMKKLLFDFMQGNSGASNAPAAKDAPKSLPSESAIEKAS